MRRYDDVVQVRRGLVQHEEAPAQFVWRERLWQVCAVLAHWVETEPWWEHRDVTELLGVHSTHHEHRGSDPTTRQGHLGGGAVSIAAEEPVGTVAVSSLLTEHEVWRVDASKGRQGFSADPDGTDPAHRSHEVVRGVFDLSLDWSTGEWRLTRCAD